MKDLKMFKVNEVYDYILLTSSRDIYYLYDEIFKLIKRLNNDKNSILVDLFYRNGYSFNRFVEIIFNDKNPILRIVNPRDIPEDIKECSKNYFRANSELLNQSTLSRGIKNFVLS